MGRDVLHANTEQMKKAGIEINADKERVAQLNEMVTRIAAVSDLPDLPYNVTLFHTNIVNAAAAPGGSMMVFEGLYNSEEALVKDEDELAAVMGHEIAHVTCRHVTERMTAVMPYALVAQIGTIILSQQNEDEWAKWLQGVFVVGSAILIPKYTRSSEAEADRIGLFYMAMAGYDPRAAVRIWKRASTRKGAQDATNILSTHPSSRDRYKVLEKLMPYAMAEYAIARGSYPRDYSPPSGFSYEPGSFNWREKVDSY